MCQSRAFTGPGANSGGEGATPSNGPSATATAEPKRRERKHPPPPGLLPSRRKRECARERMCVSSVQVPQLTNRERDLPPPRLARVDARVRTDKGRKCLGLAPS